VAAAVPNEYELVEVQEDKQPKRPDASPLPKPRINRTSDFGLFSLWQAKWRNSKVG